MTLPLSQGLKPGLQLCRLGSARERPATGRRGPWPSLVPLARRRPLAHLFVKSWVFFLICKKEPFVLAPALIDYVMTLLFSQGVPLFANDVYPSHQWRECGVGHHCNGNTIRSSGTKRPRTQIPKSTAF